MRVVLARLIRLQQLNPHACLPTCPPIALVLERCCDAVGSLGLVGRPTRLWLLRCAASPYDSSPLMRYIWAKRAPTAATAPAATSAMAEPPAGAVSVAAAPAAGAVAAALRADAGSAAGEPAVVGAGAISKAERDAPSAEAAVMLCRRSATSSMLCRRSKRWPAGQGDEGGLAVATARLT